MSYHSEAEITPFHILTALHHLRRSAERFDWLHNCKFRPQLRPRAYLLLRALWALIFLPACRVSAQPVLLQRRVRESGCCRGHFVALVIQRVLLERIVHLILGNPNPYNPLNKLSFHFIFHFLFHLILHYSRYPWRICSLLRRFLSLSLEGREFSGGPKLAPLLQSAAATGCVFSGQHS